MSCGSIHTPDAVRASPSRLGEAARARAASLAGLVLVGCLSCPGAEIDPGKLPPAAPGPVDFARDIQPIFEKTCLRCHGPEKPKSKFRLDNRESALKGGENGVDIVPGESAKSPLIHYVARLVEDMEMPPEGKGDPLTPEQVGLLRTWIDQGANWATNAPVKAFQFSATAGLRSLWVTGDRHRFREHNWNYGGVTGGFEEFQLKEQIGLDKSLEASGKVWLGNHDYDFKLSLRQTDLGFIRGGVSQYRKYFDDTGGFFPGFAPPLFSLDRDLHLDLGRAWIDLGLTIPHWPQVTLGYEYQYRDGTKSSLAWGPVSVGPTIASTNLANIYPSPKHVDEKIHIVKVDLTHEVGGFGFEDNFRGEFYDLNTRRDTVAAFDVTKAGPEKIIRTREGENHFQGMNAFKVEKQVRPWWFASGGYLYSYLDGTASFQQSTFLTPNAFVPPLVSLLGSDQFWASQRILLEQESHVFNLNSRLGPWEGLTFTAGLQTEWQSQKGFGNLALDTADPVGPPGSLLAYPTLVNSDLDKFASDENFGLRFTKIPYTVLFTETRFQQESIGQFESHVEQTETGGFHDFLRDTDATSDLKEYRTGFNVSPWSFLGLAAHYKHREKESNYEHLRDVIPTPTGDLPNTGYSAFIRWRDVNTDEIEAKLTVKWPAWLKTTFSFKVLSSDYEVQTDSVIVPRGTLPTVVVTPGGTVLAGETDSHIYSLNFSLTPWGRLALSTTLSYQEYRTDTSRSNAAAILPYRGDTLSVMETVTFALNQTTDLFGTYSYSRADYNKDRQMIGVPFGLLYDWHILQAGASKQLNKHFRTTLQYAFFTYSEPSTRGFNNYTAHGLFATLGVNWP